MSGDSPGFRPKTINLKLVPKMKNGFYSEKRYSVIRNFLNSDYGQNQNICTIVKNTSLLSVEFLDNLIAFYACSKFSAFEIKNHFSF